MLEAERAEPGSLSPDLRNRLFDALIQTLEQLEADPIAHEAVVGTQQIAAYLDGRPGTETRDQQ
jgi:hypothetical protein